MKELGNLSSHSGILLIDGDAIPWMIGWHHREHQDTDLVKESVDNWFRDFMLLTGAESFIGVLANKDTACFREKSYKYQKYKGNRTEKPDWIIFWEPIIRKHLCEEYGFQIAVPGLETDDVISALGWMVWENKIDKVFICSPDKDLKQVPGNHINYSKMGEGGNPQTIHVTAREAQKNLCMQLLTGDSTDNISGIPGIGQVKAEKILGDEDIYWGHNVKMTYQKYFGPYYGPIIYEETSAAVTLMGSKSPMSHRYEIYHPYLIKYAQSVRELT